MDDKILKRGQKIYSFFGGGKKRDGKSSFANWTLVLGLAVCKCAFAIGVGLSVCFLVADARN